VAHRTDSFDIGGLRLSAGEGRHLDLEVAVAPFELAGERYEVQPAQLPVRVDISRTTGGGYALRARFEARLTGPCMRCLQVADEGFDVDSLEVSQPGGGDELESEYLHHGVLDLEAWTRDALALTLPAQLLCRPECAGLCPTCGTDLNRAGPDHVHEREPDPRWSKLSELKFDS